MTGFTGAHCQINVDDCTNITCYNDAECVDLVNGYLCDCKSGYEGKSPLSLSLLCENQPMSSYLVFI